MPIDHTAVSVPTDLHKQTVEFYLAALKPLGYEKLMAFGPNEEATGLGVKPKADFWVMSVKEKVPNVHFAFTAQDRKTVDEFHAAALAAGAKCNGPPGLRPHYHAGYYAAFVIDPAGNNTEVVVHEH